MWSLSFIPDPVLTVYFGMSLYSTKLVLNNTRAYYTIHPKVLRVVHATNKNNFNSRRRMADDFNPYSGNFRSVSFRSNVSTNHTVDTEILIHTYIYIYIYIYIYAFAQIQTRKSDCK